MADKAISSLAEASSIGTGDKFVLEQNGQAKQLSGQTLIDALAAQLAGHGGIDNIALHSTSGKQKTYRITYTDGTYFDFVVTDGADTLTFTDTNTGPAEVDGYIVITANS